MVETLFFQAGLEAEMVSFLTRTSEAVIVYDSGGCVSSWGDGGQFGIAGGVGLSGLFGLLAVVSPHLAGRQVYCA